MNHDYDASGIQVIATAENLYVLIDQIKRRPGMYFENASLTAFYYFVMGYHQACAMKGIDDRETPPFEGFHEFVRARMNRTGFAGGSKT